MKTQATVVRQFGCPLSIESQAPEEITVTSARRIGCHLPCDLVELGQSIHSGVKL